MYTTDYFINTPLEIQQELSICLKGGGNITIFDIGSCDGIDSIRYSKLFPDSKVYAFEPLQNNILLINNNLKQYNISNVHPFQIALSNKVGISEFHISSGNPDTKEENDNWEYGNKSSSLLEPSQTLYLVPWLKFEQKQMVNTITLSAFCKEHDINKIDFIHIDVQGAELLVLKGAESMLENIKLIWMEVEKIDLYKNQPLQDDIEKFMLNYGFTKIKDTVADIDGDQLWINNGYYSSMIRYKLLLLKAHTNFNKIKAILRNDYHKIKRRIRKSNVSIRICKGFIHKETR